MPTEMSASKHTKQTYIWSTPFFDFEFVDIRTKRNKGKNKIISSLSYSKYLIYFAILLIVAGRNVNL